MQYLQPFLPQIPEQFQLIVRHRPVFSNHNLLEFLDELHYPNDISGVERFVDLSGNRHIYHTGENVGIITSPLISKVTPIVEVHNLIVKEDIYQVAFDQFLKGELLAQ
jgi:hypothetical protein